MRRTKEEEDEEEEEKEKEVEEERPRTGRERGCSTRIDLSSLSLSRFLSLSLSVSRFLSVSFFSSVSPSRRFPLLLPPSWAPPCHPLLEKREGGGKVDRGLSHYACSEETTGLDAGTAAIGL
ncbi:hypothetical protein ANTPLA_LOCUS3359 [Anthophora plagiata]